MVLVGPIELFRPEAAIAEFGGYVWLFLLVFYWLWVWLAVLVARPRLVVYNISAEELRPVLAEAARAARPAGPLGRRQPRAAHAGRVAAHGVVRDHAARVAHSPAAASRTSPAGSGSRPSCATSSPTLRVGRNPRSLGFMLAGHRPDRR